jgi:hypothetical protein
VFDGCKIYDPQSTCFNGWTVQNATTYETIEGFDARKLGERNWRNAARNRDSWQKLLRKALAQKGLLCQ